MNAVAVCPEGKEWLFDPSGRITWVVFFNVLITLPINSTEKASDASIRPPRTSALNTKCFHAKHGDCWGVLQIVIKMATKLWEIVVAEMAKMSVFFLDDSTSDDERHTDIGHLIERRGGEVVDFLTKRRNLLVV